MKEASKVFLIISVVFTIISTLLVLIFLFASYSIDVDWMIENINTTEINGETVKMSEELARIILTFYRAMLITYLIIDIASVVIQFIAISKSKNPNYDSLTFPIIIIVLGVMTSILSLIAGILWTISIINTRKLKENR